MINIRFTDIDNARLVGRLLPWYARGKKTSLLLQGLLAPLEYVHAIFKKWALETYIEAHITAQRASLEWYLKYKLGGHFADPSDVFRITHQTSSGDASDTDDIFIAMNLACQSQGKWNNELYWIDTEPWVNDEGEAQAGGSASVHDLANSTNVFAPAIVETLEYDMEDYERDIRYILSKYLTTFKNVNIIIARTNAN